MEPKSYESRKQLPLEILAEIACIFPKNIWKFACVCRQWRHAAILHPHCWSHMRVKYARKFEDPASMNARLDLWIQRSGETKLEILMEGPFSYLLLSAPLANCLPRIRKLHLDDWPQEFNTDLQTYNFPCLEALSLSTTRDAGITLSRLTAAFLYNPSQLKSGTSVRSPRLRELALSGIFIDTTFSPTMPSLLTLKLSSCIVGMSVSFLDLLDQFRHSLQAAYLWNVERQQYRPPIPEADTLRVEYPHLKCLTLMFDHASSTIPQDFLSHISSTRLVKLTCNDSFLPLLRTQNLPHLSHIYVDSYQSSSHKTYDNVLNQFRILSLTIYRDPRSRECGLNTLLWSMVNSPEFGKTLRRVRYFTMERIPQTILDRVNEERSRDPFLEGESVFASQVLIGKLLSDGDYSPWDTELWWTRK